MTPTLPASSNTFVLTLTRMLSSDSTSTEANIASGPCGATRRPQNAQGIDWSLMSMIYPDGVALTVAGEQEMGAARRKGG